jgi:hypothetical protein
VLDIWGFRDVVPAGEIKAVGPALQNWAVDFFSSPTNFFLHVIFVMSSTAKALSVRVSKTRGNNFTRSVFALRSNCTELIRE